MLYLCVCRIINMPNPTKNFRKKSKGDNLVRHCISCIGCLVATAAPYL